MDYTFIKWFDSIDNSLMLLLNYDGGAVQDRVWWTVSSKAIWVIPAVLFAVHVFRKYHWRDAVAMLLCLTLTVALCDQVSSGLMKPLFMRLRPSHEPAIQDLLHYVGNYRGGMYGFVSSHAANAFGAVAFVSRIVRRKAVTIVLVAFALLVGYSRIYLGVHYPGDVACGALLGVAVGNVMYKVCMLRGRIWKITGLPAACN